jgi:hypothetical protein
VDVAVPGAFDTELVIVVGLWVRRLCGTRPTCAVASPRHRLVKIAAPTLGKSLPY